MIKLIEDCEIVELFNKGIGEANMRYWYFSAYNGPKYNLFWNDEISCEEEDAIIENFLHPEGNFINIGKFDDAFPYFAMDEWTSIIGFKAKPEQAVAIAKFIDEQEMSPERIQHAYPGSDICGFYWISGWWEAYGRADLLSKLIQPSLISFETASSEYLSLDCDVAVYRADKQKLLELIASKKSTKSNKGFC